MADLALTATLGNDGIGLEDVETLCIAAPATSLEFDNANDRILVIINNSGAVRTVTVNSTTTKFGDLDDTNRAHDIPSAGGICFIPFLSTEMFNDAGTGKVSVTIAVSEVDMKVGLFKLTKTL